MKHIATLVLRQPLSHLTKAQREAFADLLGEYASDILKGACIGEPVVRFEIPDGAPE